MSKHNLYNHLEKGNTQPFRIYRGEVKSVETSEETGKRTIYIKEYGGLDEPPYIEALPPSFIPLDLMGSGVMSIPIPGTQCLVIEGTLNNTALSRAQILSFLPSKGIHNEGSLKSVEDIGDGDFYFKLGGRLKTTFKMTKMGQIQAFAGNFAFFDINGDLMRIESQSKRFLRKNSVGLYLNEWIEPDLMNPLVYERTSHTSTFTTTPESPMDSDGKLDTEETVLVPLLRPYVNKTVVRAGKIPNKKQLLEDSASHTYTIDTRNSTGLNPFQKDTVTKLEVGYQGGHYPYGSSLFHRAPGNLINWSAKRNTVGNIGTFVWRYGKLESHSGTKAPLAPAISAVPEEDLSGEVFRRQIYQGLNFDAVPLGVPVINPLGFGEGYGEGDASNAFQNFTESYGKLDGISPGMVTNPIRGSLWRRLIHDQIIDGTGFYVDERYGGQGVSMGVEPDYYSRTMGTKIGGVDQDSWTERFGKTLPTGGYHYNLELKDGVTQAQSTMSIAPMQLKLENKFTPNLSTNSLVFDHGTTNAITLMHQFTSLMGAIEITGTTITINSNNGLGQILIDTANPASPFIELTAGPLKVKMDNASGFQVGGNSVAMASLVDWILGNASAFGIGNMGAPVPIFPGAIVPLGIEANLTASTIVGGQTSGMKSGV